MQEQIKSFASSSVLYYPSIEFHSETWIKSSLLFWDKIYRIVPESYKPKDSNEINIAISNGLIENIELTDKDLKRTADRFLNFIEGLSYIPSGLSDSNYNRLHADKVDDRLKSYFSNNFKQDKQGFYNTPKLVSNGYMFYLSETVSKRRNIAKLTDNADMYTAMIYFEGKGNFDEPIINEENPESYTNLIIERLIPKDIRSLKIDTIINLHKSS